MHPINGAFRFGLELGALGALGWWGFEQLDGPGRYGLMVGAPLLAAAAWGIFAVPDDPSRGGQGLVRVPGPVRLLIEAAVFAAATAALVDVDQVPLALGFGAAVVLHYSISFRRIGWLLSR